jgi:type IV secretory pathway protease TraF
MVFLLMSETTDSFDGRYFGPTLARDLIGKATPLWLR